MSDKKVLNRGLDALLGSAQGTTQRAVKEIQISEKLQFDIIKYAKKRVKKFQNTLNPHFLSVKLI